jgi:2,3-dihydroxyphenylpropionate 1,2-dioxygenase
MTRAEDVYMACAVHVPLMAMQDKEANPEFWRAYQARVEEFQEFDPELVVVFGCDHYDNVFLNLSPQFTVGFRAHAVDDCGGTPGPLDVPMDVARACAVHLTEAGFDVATSYDMGVDHGFSSVLGNFMGGDLASRPVIPIYVNALYEPRPTLKRCRQLGETVGEFCRGLGRRVAFLGSGGLSHKTDSIFPQFDTSPDETMRDYIVSGGGQGTLTREEFMDKIQRAMDVRSAELLSGEATTTSVNPEWDAKFLEVFATGDMTRFDAWTDAEVAQEGGSGAGEIRQWIAAASAAGVTEGDVIIDFYTPRSTLAVGVGVAHSSIAATAGVR